MSLSDSSRADDIIISEIASAPPFRRLNRHQDPPQLGVGPTWFDPAFDDRAWTPGQGPFGFGFSNVVTDLDAAMSGKTPSVYLRCVFSVTPDQLAGDAPLRCLLNFNDGFVGILNGREFGRANLGPAGMFIPARHPSFNARTSAEPVTLDLGPASRFLKPGPNLLALQIHNTWPWTDALPHDPTFLAETRLFLGDGAAGDLVGNTSDWRWFAGVTEPSGAFRDPDLLRSAEDGGEFHDWLELHNRGNRDVDLKNWSLSDDPANPRKWIFPSQRLEPGGYLVVFCTGLDRRSAVSGFLHTNFRLDRQGESLTLHRPDGTFASGFQSAYPALDGFHSYGIDDSTGIWGYYPEPSPGLANSRTELFGQTAPVTLAPPPGFHSEDVTVEMSCPTPFARIRFTLDGSDPTSSNGFDYTQPVLLTTNATVRARAFRSHWIPSEIATATYFVRIPGDLTHLPALVLSGDTGRTFFAPEGLTAVSGGSYEGPFQDELWTPGSPDDYNMYLVSGPAVERPATVEWLDPNGASAGPWNCGLRVSSSVWSTPRMLTPPGGNIIWNHDDLSFRIKPSFGLFFRGEYGLSELDFPLFDGIGNGEGGTRFDDLRLRAGKNDWANPFIRDELVRRLFGQLGQISGRGVLVNLFINGEFKSYYNLVERPRGNFLRAHTGSTADWDILLPNEIAEGDDTRWKEDEAFLLGASLADDARYQEASRRFDVVNLIDYALLNLFCGTADWPENNWVLDRERSPAGQWRFHVWDAEMTFGYQSLKNVTFDTLSNDLLSTNTPPTVVAEVFSAFYQNPEFRRMFADRAQRHLLGQGTLTETNVVRVANELHQQVAPSIRFVRREEIRTAYLAFWAANRLPSLLPALAQRGLWPSVAAPRILFATNAPPSVSVVSSNASDVIYFTLDGSDPRLAGGSVNTTARPATEPILLPGPVTISARALRGNEWSPLATADYRLAPPEPLEITEIHYAPTATAGVDGRAFEFVEIQNTGASAVALDGVAFNEGIQFEFPDSASLEPGAFAVLVSDAAAFQSRYPEVPVAGVFTGRLDNSGERLTLSYRQTYPLVSLTYNDKAPWPTSAAGLGFSLVPSDEPGTLASDPRHWRASSLPGGSPGRVDGPPKALPVVINEVFPYPNAGQPGWIELHNPTPQAVDISYWWLTDDPSVPRKFVFADGTILPPDGFLVLDTIDLQASAQPLAPSDSLSSQERVRVRSAPSSQERVGVRSDLSSPDRDASLRRTSLPRSLPAVPEAPRFAITQPASGPGSGLKLSPAGGRLLLYLADSNNLRLGGSSDFVYEAVDEGVAYGRTLDEEGAEFLAPLSHPTPDHPNDLARTGSVILQEIGLARYRGDSDFIEIANRSQEPVALHARGQPLRPWRVNGIDFDFPPRFTLAPGELIVICAADPQVFRAQHEIADTVRILGPWAGQLDVTGETLRLERPSKLPEGDVIYLSEDRVRFRTTPPWPSALPVGASLQRRPGPAPGDSPALWAPAPATPGQANFYSPGLRLAAPGAPGWIPRDASVFVTIAAPSLSGSISTPTLTLYANQQPVGTNQGSAAEVSWNPSDLPSNAVELRAVATTADGTEFASSPLGLRVLDTRVTDVALIPTNALWKVLQSALLLAPAWTGLAFDDASWKDAGLPESEQHASSSDLFTYRRHALLVSDASTVGSYQVHLDAAPGTVLFLNQRALASVPSNAPAAFDFPLDAAWLQPGTNLFAAVEPPRPDGEAPRPFLFQLNANQTVTEPWIAEPPVDQEVPVGAPASFSVRVAGTPTALQWFHTAAGQEPRALNARTTTLSLPTTSLDDSGSYFAVVTNDLGSVTSRLARLSLLPADSDRDGLPDDWELRFGLNPADPADALADTDGDGLTNLEEYQRTSDPTQAASPSTVVISEIMYRPASANPAHEFVELLNTGSTAVNLDGWRFTRGIQFTFANAVLEPGAALAVAADPAALTAVSPGVSHLLGPWTGTLSNSGEPLELVDAAGRVIKRVAYANEGDWAQRRRGPLSVGARGWEWFAEHDGLGKSLELIQPALANSSGQNWTASRVAGGTPGAPNSVAQTNVAPLVNLVTHLPILPTPASIVRVQAAITDETPTGIQAQIFYRIHKDLPPPSFVAVPMADDGLHGDGLAGDGIWAGDLPPQPEGAVVEYYVSATDPAGLERRWPAPALDESLSPVQSDNALYLVTGAAVTPTRPRFRLLMTETERSGLESADRRSNAAFNAAVIIDDGANLTVRQRISLRIRGASTRFAAVPNLRLHFPSDQTWQGLEDINLNTYEWAPSQIVGSVLALQSGVPAAQARPVDVFLNTTNRALQGAHVQLQVVDGAWASDLFPRDPDGNVYSARRPNTDLAYLGTNAALYAAFGYAKESNREANDWSDLIRLTDVLSNTPDADFAQAVRAVLDPEEWIRYFAFNSVLGNSETSLGSGVGDDYDLYRGLVDSRFQVVAHDLDSLLSFTISMPINTGIFQAAAVRAVDRFLKHPEFAPLYFHELDRLTRGPCSPEQIEAVARYWLDGFTDPAVACDMAQYARLRGDAIQSQIPRQLTLVHGLPIVAGYPRTADATVALGGSANAITTRSVRLNGSAAAWIAWQGRWTNAAVALRPGLNRIILQALDATGNVTDELAQDLWYETEAAPTSPITESELATDTTWTAAQSPYWIAQTFTVPVGRTLTIEPGASIYFASNAVLSIYGRILADGTAEAPIRFSARPGEPHWGGIGIVNSTNENRLRHAVLDNPGPNALRIDNSRALLEHLEFITTATCLFFNNASLRIRQCHFPHMDGAEAIIGYGILPGGELVLDGNRFDGTTGYSDLVDFTGGKRPGPILQAYNNVFADGSDDGLDLDGTDAHIEGNVFLRFHRDDPRESLSAGVATDLSADIVAVRNWFIDCDNGVLLKNGAQLTSQHNLYLGQLEAAIVVGSTNPAVLPAGAMSSSGDIFWKNAHTLDPRDTAVALESKLSIAQSLIDDPLAAGHGNRSGDPLFVNETNDFRLRPGSPALGSGPNGLDIGPIVPAGVSIAGEPPPITPRPDATLTFGGPGITHYLYRLDQDAFSTNAIPISTPLVLTNLAPGTHQVAAIGRNSAGVWQSPDQAAISRSWTVDPALRRLVINEVLARNAGAFNHHGTTPDAVELYNAGAAVIDLAGMQLTDDPDRPGRFVFPQGTLLEPGAFLVLLADDPNSTAGLHLGFGLDGSGDRLELREAVNRGGQLLDAVEFGLQIPNLSLSRNARGAWTLGSPTLGAANVELSFGDPSRLRLSEWLAAGGSDDFVELQNPSDLPVPLAGVSLTDKPLGLPNRDVFPPLSFLGPRAFVSLIADNDAAERADHLAFKLSRDQGELAVFSAQGDPIDRVAYNAQRTGVSEGRRNPADLAFVAFADPTPGAPNRQNLAPSIELSTPVDRQFVAFPTDLVLEANATDADGSVVQVEFYVGTQKLGTVTRPPYRWVWTNAPAAAHRFQARAIDDEGAAGISTSASIQPISPNCTLTVSNAPFPQILGRPSRLAAAVTNSPLAVIRMLFFIDDTLVGDDATSPYEVEWVPTRKGPVTLRAEARLVGNVPARSNPVTTMVLDSDIVSVTLVPATATWHYADPNTAPSTNWSAANYDDHPWPTGPAPLGYGSADLATPLPPPDAGPRPLASYFRHRFDNENGTFTNVTLRLLRDDGAAVFWNGTELLRDNLPSGAMDWTTPAASPLVSAEDEDWIVRRLEASPVTPGGNQLAVEIHQHTDSTEDLRFALEVTAEQVRIEPWIIEEPVSFTVDAPNSARFEVKAMGQPLSYQWYRVGVGLITNAQSAILLVRGAEPRDVGGYYVVVSNDLGAQTSRVAQLTVNAPDSDGDGLPDYWENRFGLNPADPTDTNGDLDGDGLTDAEEYRRGSRPLAWNDWMDLRHASEGLPTTSFLLRFSLRALNNARVEMSPSLAPSSWQVLGFFSPAETNRIEAFLVPVSSTVPQHFFRVIRDSTDTGNPDPSHFAWIPPGTFTMGTLPTEQDRWPQEGPQTRVTLTRGYWMSRFEITQGEFLSLMHTNPAYLPGDLSRPAEWVSWFDAVEYCARRTEIERANGRIPQGYAYRLPTEAEWEYACRAGTTTRFNFGNDYNLTELDDYAWYTKNSGYDFPPEPTWWEFQGRYYSAHPVGQKRPNAWGLHDMHGNVKEWTANWYSDSLPGGEATDPKGPESGEIRTVRGGTWGYEGWFVRVGYREARYPDYKSRSIGFRPILAPTAP
ncbi:MAG: lamin tail domain-containing protein [Verrucomicrobiales bacterium]|nr:lamin tail domain-containing protein [Verrucomicrobiales bacterium]